MQIETCSFLYLIPFVCFMGAAVNALAGRHIEKSLCGRIATAAIGSSFLFSVAAVVMLWRGNAPYLSQHLWTWMTAGDLDVEFGLRVDNLTSLMMLVVTGVGTLIHVYSIGYMEHEDDNHRYFAELNLFAAFMLVLVMGSNLLVMFIGWEGVGLCSYLLIGFYYKEPEKAAAGRKAFIVNRVGDAFFVSGVLLLLYGLRHLGQSPSLDFEVLRTNVVPLANRLVHISLSNGTVTMPTEGLEPDGGFTASLVTVVGLLLFIGATGKSAQIPLYVWLPDAMAGPTPVSALIHAATMVTAGVFMVCRLCFLFTMSGVAMATIAWTGALTALMAGLIALTQRDIKKILAYSTISQLGYMFLAAGVGAFGAAAFHLATHAFFKALLFLGAGSVIHALHGEQDIFKMGGLKEKIPQTYKTFLIGALALSGIPPLAGFFSKDQILFLAYGSSHGGILLYLVGLVTALLTAFYTTRLMCLVFWTPSRMDPKVEHHVHESGPFMLWPLWILAGLTCVAGLLNLPFGVEWLDHKLHPSFAGVAQGITMPDGDHSLELVLLVISVVVAGSGILAARTFYLNPEWRRFLDDCSHTATHDALSSKLWVDEVYDFVIVRPLMWFSRFLRDFVDGAAIDGGLVQGPPQALSMMSHGMRMFQNGDVQRYLVLLMLGAVAVLVNVFHAP